MGEEHTLHELLYRRLRKLILSGALCKGARLPSSRTLALNWGVSRNSVLTALDRLVADGWIEARRGSGVFVAYEGKQPRSANRPRSKPVAGLLPFGIVNGPADLFPVAIWKRLQSRQWNRTRNVALNAEFPAGVPELQEAIAAHLATSRGLECAPEQVIITTSIRSGLDLAIRALDLRGACGFSEDPGYFNAWQSLSFSGVRMHPVPIDEQGFDIELVKSEVPEARFALVVSASQFPMCIAMSESRRKALVHWALEQGRWIFEDDYDWHSGMGAPLPAPIAAFERQRTMYFGSFHQLLFRGVRIGFVVVPPALIDRFTAANSALEAYGDVPKQIVLADFIAGGHLDAHLRRLRTALAERRNALLTAIEQELCAYFRPRPTNSGGHLICEPVSSPAAAIAECAAAQNIFMRTTNYFRLQKIANDELMLGFSGFDVPTIRRTARALNRALGS